MSKVFALVAASLLVGCLKVPVHPTAVPRPDLLTAAELRALAASKTVTEPNDLGADLARAIGGDQTLQAAAPWANRR